MFSLGHSIGLLQRAEIFLKVVEWEDGVDK